MKTMPRPLMVGSLFPGEWLWWCRRCTDATEGEAPSGKEPTVAAANESARRHWSRCDHNPASLPSILAAISVSTIRDGAVMGA